MRAIRSIQSRWRAQARDRQGFTLVEVLVVLLILTIGILPLALVQSQARREVNEADRYTEAMTRAQRELEWAKGLGFNNAAPDSGIDGALAWRTDVVDVDVGLRQVSVSVIFAQGSTPDTLTMVSLLSLR